MAFLFLLWRYVRISELENHRNALEIVSQKMKCVVHEKMSVDDALINLLRSKHTQLSCEQPAQGFPAAY